MTATIHPRIEVVLSDSGVDHQVHRHADLPGPITSPSDFAAAMGYDMARITKTVFMRSQDAEIYAAVVCSANRRLDFKAVAKVLGKRMEVASKLELEERVGYPPNGVSPLGLDPAIRVLIDEALESQPTVLIGGGEAAVEVEIAPKELARLSNAQTAAISK